MVYNFPDDGVFIPTRLGTDGAPNAGYIAIKRTHMGPLEPLKGKNVGVDRVRRRNRNKCT